MRKSVPRTYIMKVLLLAAGRSKRMKPIDDKNFLNFCGKSLIQHQLEMLKENGFNEIVVVGGAHNLDKIRKLGESLGLQIDISEQEDLEMGMCGAVLAGKEFINNDEAVLVMSSNDLVDSSAFEAIKEAYEAGGAESYILGYKVLEYFPGGYLETNAEGFIHNIVEKPEPSTEPSDLVNLVVHLHGNYGRLLEELERVKSDSDDLYEIALANMMKAGIKFKAVSYEGFWQAIKFPWHVQKVFMHFFEKAEKGVDKSAQIAEGAKINGEVIIAENVKIFDGAVVNGPAYIGPGSVVATNALVRESCLGAGCVIGFSTEVARSYLGDEVWTHSNYIGDSVIGNNVSFGAGTVIGNLRFDEKNVVVDYDGKKYDSKSNKFGCIIGDNVRFGINASIMPGVRIGSGSLVGAGLVLAENVPDNSFVRGEWNLKISENKMNLGDSDRSEFKKKL